MGNTLVNRKGVTLTQEIGDSGVYGSASSGETEAIQVRKCRGCGEILTSANYTPSPEEVAAAERARQEDQRRFPVAALLVALAATCCLLVISVFYLSLPLFERENPGYQILLVVLGGPLVWLLGVGAWRIILWISSVSR